MHRAWFGFVVGNINGELPDQGHLEPGDAGSALFVFTYKFVVL